MTCQESDSRCNPASLAGSSHPGFGSMLPENQLRELLIFEVPTHIQLLTVSEAEMTNLLPQQASFNKISNLCSLYWNLNLWRSSKLWAPEGVFLLFTASLPTCMFYSFLPRLTCTSSIFSPADLNWTEYLQVKALSGKASLLLEMPRSSRQERPAKGLQRAIRGGVPAERNLNTSHGLAHVSSCQCDYP